MGWRGAADGGDRPADMFFIGLLDTTRDGFRDGNRKVSRRRKVSERRALSSDRQNGTRQQLTRID